jgi:hypothetical protein
MSEETKKPNNPNAFPTDLDIQKETESGYYYQTGMTLIKWILSLFKNKPNEPTAICNKPISKANECCAKYGEDCCMFNQINN